MEKAFFPFFFVLTFLSCHEEKDWSKPTLITLTHLSADLLRLDEGDYTETLDTLCLNQTLRGGVITLTVSPKKLGPTWQSIGVMYATEDKKVFLRNGSMATPTEKDFQLALEALKKHHNYLLATMTQKPKATDP